MLYHGARRDRGSFRLTYGCLHPQAYEECTVEAQAPRLDRHDDVASHLSCGIPTHPPLRSCKKPTTGKTRDVSWGRRMERQPRGEAEAVVEHIYI